MKSTPLYSRLGRLAIVGTLSTLGVLTGIIPGSLSTPFKLTSGSIVLAQAPVTQYAEAAFEIEQMRQRDYTEAKRIMGGNVPGDVCRQSNIPQPVRDICNRFLSNSSEIIKKHGLTVTQFNELTRRKNSDPALQQQIQNELLRLQKGK